MAKVEPLVDSDTRKRLASVPLMEKLRLLESVSEKVNAGAKRSPEVTSKLDGPSIVGGELVAVAGGSADPPSPGFWPHPASTTKPIIKVR